MTSQFINNENMNMLWEIIYDLYENDPSNQGKFINPNTTSTIKQNFIINSNNFIENAIKANSQMDLLTLNKTFISNYINSMSNNSKRETSITPIKSIKIEKAEPELITFEEIQKNRRNEFDEILKLKQKDFENSMKNPVPEPVEFKVGDIDKPIGEMEDLIARTVAQRNFEIEQIHNQYSNSKDAEKWLHSQETSLQSEKTPIKAMSFNERYEPAPTSISLQDNLKENDNNKHVRWSDNITINIEERNESPRKTSNIFNKLKMKSNDNSEKNSSNNDELMDSIKNIQADIIFIKENFKSINTLLGQILENKIDL
jgi:hypothetical protein